MRFNALPYSNHFITQRFLQLAEVVSFADGIGDDYVDFGGVECGFDVVCVGGGGG
jgi:hypothetical protein